MDRREFVYGLSSAMAAAGARSGVEQAPVAVRLVKPDEGEVMPSDFSGLSYEAGQLYNPEFFSARNRPLIEAFRGLSSKGVLRTGGHLSNITRWEGVGQDEPKQVRGVRHGIEDYWEWPLVDPTVQRNKAGVITRHSIENLRGFLDAVDWRLIYGLNFASGSAARAADEAAAVQRIVGERLIAFVIGNEVDGFGDDPFFRAKGYGFDQYIAEFDQWVRTIRARVPKAQFAGPDTDGKVDTWVVPFAKHTRGEVALLTSHYYGMGPASAPGMAAERLLRKDNAELEKEIAGVHAAQAAAGGTPYRMDEGNSCFGGGKQGVSDAYPSALWAADYMLRVACEGFAGVNLHGGGVGIYTPIETSANAPAGPRPVYFGMQFAQQFAGWRMKRLALNSEANIAGYQGSKGSMLQLALVNKGAAPLKLQLPELMTKRDVQRWELTGPGLGAKSGVRFEVVPAPTAKGVVDIRGYSGVILRAS